MKIGLSTYSLSRAIGAGDIDVLGAIQWIADNGGEHVEMVPIGYTLTDNESLVRDVVQKAADLNLDISSYTIGAQFIQENNEAFQAEIERVKKEVDIAHALGVKLMRHDVASRPIEETSVAQLEKDMPVAVQACQEVADYAKQYGITTSIENHGYHMQGSERVQRLILAVDRDNFKTTLDVGNFLCVDEDPIAAVNNNVGFASMVHLKDFYVRGEEPSEGWLRSKHGRFLRGAIVGQGDVDLVGIVSIIKESGFDGYVSIEFEGVEDCFVGSKRGMDYARDLWESL
jgi:sugar phosphate isomerase/epimerase